MNKTIGTGIGIWTNHFGALKLAGQMAKAVENSGSVDQQVVWDQSNRWWPQALWEPSCTVLAKHVSDTDSSADLFYRLLSHWQRSRSWALRYVPIPCAETGSSLHREFGRKRGSYR